MSDVAEKQLRTDRKHPEPHKDGRRPEMLSDLMSELNGRRRQLFRTSPPIYLIERALRQLIPTANRYDSLFRDWNDENVDENPSLLEITPLSEITSSAVLVRTNALRSQRAATFSMNRSLSLKLMALALVAAVHATVPPAAIGQITLTRRFRTSSSGHARVREATSTSQRRSR
jgi:hypothetical protein